MKNTFLFWSFIFLFFIGCRAKRISVNVLPCESETIDDSMYIRELGHGISIDMQFARDMAIQEAKYKIVNRFIDSVRASYLAQVNYDSICDSIYVGHKDTILFRYPLSYFGELSYTRKECEKITFDAKKQYHCFITLALPKKDIATAHDKVFLDYIKFIASLSQQTQPSNEVINELDSITIKNINTQ